MSVRLRCVISGFAALILSWPVCTGGPNSGHAAELKTGHRGGHWLRTCATKIPYKTGLSLEISLALRSWVSKTCILWRRSGLNLDRPLHIKPPPRSATGNDAAVAHHPTHKLNCGTRERNMV